MVRSGRMVSEKFYSLIHLKSNLTEKIIQNSIKINERLDDYCGNYSVSDKEKLQNFLRYIENKIIFIDDAPSFINLINNELNFWNLDEIPLDRFRCIKSIFYEIIGKTDPHCKEKYNSLDKCCEYFGLEPGIKMFPEIFTDSDINAALLLELYEKIYSNSL